jgi:hypothetical protein
MEYFENAFLLYLIYFKISLTWIQILDSKVNLPVVSHLNQSYYFSFYLIKYLS